jgi:hypothetical protein
MRPSLPGHAKNFPNPFLVGGYSFNTHDTEQCEAMLIPRPPVLRPRGNNGALRRSDVHCWPASAVLGRGKWVVGPLRSGGVKAILTRMPVDCSTAAVCTVAISC